MNLQQNRYLETAVQTASPEQLLIMLYDGAIRFCRTAIDAIEKQHYEDANLYLIKVQNIIREFQITLDTSSPIADGLFQLYDYFIRRLIEANTTKKNEPVQEVLSFLVELKDTWVQAAKAVNAQKKQSQAIRHG